MVRGVKPLFTILRSRVWSGGSMLSIIRRWPTRSSSEWLSYSTPPLLEENVLASRFTVTMSSCRVTAQKPDAVGVRVPVDRGLTPQRGEHLVRDPGHEVVRIVDVDVGQFHGFPTRDRARRRLPRTMRTCSSQEYPPSGSGADGATRTCSSVSSMTTEPHLLIEREATSSSSPSTGPKPATRSAREMLVGAYDAWNAARRGPRPARRHPHRRRRQLLLRHGPQGDRPIGVDRRRVDASASRRRPDLHWKALLRHFRPSKPIIAAVEGYCVAGGTEILQATEHPGRRRERPVRHRRGAPGPVPAGRVDGAAPAPDPLHHRRRPAAHRPARSRAAEAKDIGLIGHVVPDGQALAKAQRARRADRRQRPARRAGRARARCARPTDLPEKDGLALELELGWPVFATEDAKEGPRAFAEKRPADFKGR